jgi:hypothetical protein
VITRPITLTDQRDTVSGGMSWVTSIVPGMTQALNKEYGKAAIFAGLTAATAVWYGLSKNYAAVGFGEIVFFYQYADGVYSSNVFEDQKAEIFRAAYLEKENAMEVEAQEKERNKEMATLEKYGFSANQLDGIRYRREFWIGMPIEALYVSMGKPEKENRTVNEYTVHIQHVYDDSDLLIYSENGIVTAWQD